MFVLGKEFARGQLHTEYDGQQRGGISTPARFPLIFLFTGDSGQQYGYEFDRWASEDVYFYTGEGQKGDMRFDRGNLAVFNHVADGKDLHLFRNTRRGFVQYLGQMLCVSYHECRGQDMHGNGRKVIVFELLSMEEVKRPESAMDQDLWNSELKDLKQMALNTSSGKVPPEERIQLVRRCSQAIRTYALMRADGVCESCGEPAPFISKRGTPYLEVHHLRRLSDGGPDHPEWVAAVCPNCHRRVHDGQDSDAFNKRIVHRIHVKEKVASVSLEVAL